MRRLFALLLFCVLVVSSYAASLVRIGVLLPLKEQSARSTTMIEFYRGLLMAVDAVKAEGTSVEVTAVDCGSSETSLKQALREPALQRLDVIFGPVDAVQVTTLSEFCREHGIRMVLPFNTPCPQVYSNPWIYQVGVMQELLYPGITTLVMENMPSCNFVFYYTAEQDERALSFTNHLSQVLRLRNLPTANLAIGADEFAYDRALNQYRENVIIPDSRSQTALSKMLAGIKAYQQTHPKYKVSLLGYPEWLTYTQTMLKDFYSYNTYVFSTYYRNPLTARTAKFEQQYQRNFNRASRNSYPKAEMMGYDLGMYFLHGIAQLGKEFDERQSELVQQPVQHTFNFQHVGEQGGFVNLNVQLVHYLPNNTIQVVK